MPVTLKSRIPEIAASIPLRTGAAIKVGVEAMAADAKAVAPDPAPTGQYLKASIEARSGDIEYGRDAAFAPSAAEHGFATPLGRQLVTENAYGIYAAWYWHFVEYGTSRSVAKPFITPAVEAGTPALLAEVKASLRSL